MRTPLLAGLCLAVIASSAIGQTVRGSVVGEGDRPVSGVVVTLVDATSKEIARALTDKSGEYRLVAPRPGTYRLRTLRIGFQSLLTEPIALAAGADVTRRLPVSTLVVKLDTIRATGRNPCRVVAGDSTSVVAAVWDQVRSALIATQLSLSGNVNYATSVNYHRILGARSQRAGSEQLNVRSEYAKQPWTSLGIDSLRTAGYVFTTRQNTRMYYAPDLTALLSDLFVEGHCFRIAKASTDERLGVEFEPTSDRRNVTEIRGTLWLDRKTNELMEIEYRYANGGLRADEERVAGGEVGFTSMDNGLWTISRWNLRMPVPVVVPVYTSSFAVSRYETRVDSIKVSGAELMMVTTTGTHRDTIWVNPAIDSLNAVVAAKTLTLVAAASPTPTPVTPAAVQPAVLDTVVTTDAVGDPALAEFEKRRKRGIGHFITRAEIDRRGGYALSGLLQGLPGLRIAGGPSGEWGYNSTQRCNGMETMNSNAGSNGSTCSLFYKPSADEARQGIQSRCFAKVYVDHALMNPGLPTPPYNLRDITPSGIEAIEYYSHPAEMPVQYRGMNASCGLIIIHTRRHR